MKKKTRRQIKQTTKTLRKAFRKAGKPIGIASGALTLGGLAAVVAFDPEVRERSRAFAGATRDFFLKLGGRARHQIEREQPLLETTH